MQPQQSQTAPPPKEPKQLSDQKTIDALLAVTRAEMERDERQKAEHPTGMPDSALGRYAYKLVYSFRPSVLARSPSARRHVLGVALMIAAAVVLSLLAAKFIRF